MIITVASGKGGTGKTTVAVSLALSVEKNVQLLDSDVEEPNTHIFIKPKISQKEDVSIKVPQVDLEKCTFCGKCSSVCAFNAIAVVPGTVNIFSELCHSCGACKYFCPNEAISEIDKPIGLIEIGKKNEMEFIQGELNVGQAMPTPIIKALKKYIDRDKHTIIDAPPGTSCSMVHSVINSDYCILVTEPTPFGLNDLKLAVEVLIKLKIPFGVIINRCDIGNNAVEKYCQDQDIEILMKIPFSRKIAEGYSSGESLIETLPEYKAAFQKLFTKINGGYGQTNSNS
ncbi:MAG: cobyrinic acid ac-diamide synthase [uncultured bacterium]|nr:MAG: cobyrinic acid ac-diamide synthase [uncultured bacterium]